ncbi:putative o-methyltransferase protein [Eutypa lata UCREL1]|uniref:Putative o-methyltransferase protein n=1 Tax=Eutypa lata (strain UCR-EL1) TaxID=1287681 RepID=M7SIA6_EUTLA|nr:putative o-methyltransferase protein [Eutypa lata UCREL1]
MPTVGKGQASASRCRCDEAKTPVHGYLHSMVEIGMMKVLMDHEIFDAIPGDGSISIRELADNTGAELAILERFSRFLVAARVLSSPSQGSIAHTPISQKFQDPRAKVLFSHMFDFILVPATEWSEYFDLNGLAEPKNPNRTPFGLAAGHPNKSFYELLDTMPERAGSFNSMAAALGEMPVTGLYDFNWPSLDVAAGDICMMNFGGKWRDESMFHELASRSGLKISSISKGKNSDFADIEMVPA